MTRRRAGTAPGTVHEFAPAAGHSIDVLGREPACVWCVFPRANLIHQVRKADPERDRERQALTDRILGERDPDVTG